MQIERDDPVRVDMKALLRALTELHRQYPKMDLSQIIVLLQVLLEPGVTARDLLSRIDTKKSTLSRNVRYLSTLSHVDAASGDKESLMLIAQTPSEEDARYMHLSPTRKLVTLAERLSHLMKG